MKLRLFRSNLLPVSICWVMVSTLASPSYQAPLPSPFFGEAAKFFSSASQKIPHSTSSLSQSVGGFRRLSLPSIRPSQLRLTPSFRKSKTMTGFANSWRGNFWGGQSSRLMGRVPPSALERLRAFRKRPQLERLEAFRARPETRLERLKAFKDPSSAQRFGTTTNAGQGARAELSQLERERQSFLERLKGWDLTELQHQQAIAESRLAAWSKSSSSNYEKLKRD